MAQSLSSNKGNEYSSFVSCSTYNISYLNQQQNTNNSPIPYAIAIKNNQI